jgi:methylmalonyl-CoA/ethylmalonyl-CoA epimerase
MTLANATIGQLMIPVENFEKGVAFYRDVLGLPFLFAAPPQMAFFSCGNVRILVGVVPFGQKAQRGSAIYFRVPDIRSAFATLGGKGVQFLAAPHIVNRTPTSELWLAEFTDPDLNQFALMSEVATGTA